MPRCVVCTAAAVGALLAAPACEAAAQAYKVQRASNYSDSFRLDDACGGCFPKDSAACASDDVWDNCCKQEVECHDFHCRELVMGELSSNTQVRVLEEFESDDDQKVTLAKGMKGRVLRIDGQGDAYIKFQRDELDDEGIKSWVYKTTFWKKLELPGKAERLRAARTVDCLDACSLQFSCKFAEEKAAKAVKKGYKKCVDACNIDKCQKEADCKSRFEQYAICKQKTAMGDACSPLASLKAKSDDAADTKAAPESEEMDFEL
eukprot:TRINITY_DN10585_c0_g1_i1.p1 TRINITY_DN10585_c0_g1~~TRINITY_DN10585_c0_g1_i1.p1  ORF type:complete len:299 (-),score=83.85 TRINITY_DN10585_c0_g1_i1:79-864(-)